MVTRKLLGGPTSTSGMPKTTKEGWREWVEYEYPEPVELLDPEEFRALAKSKKAADRDRLWAHNSARHRHHAQMPPIDTPAVVRAHDAMWEAVQINQDRESSDFGVAVTAEGTYGKSWVLYGFGRDYERRVRRSNPEHADDKNWTPVVYVAAPPSASPLMLAQQIAHFLATPLPAKGQNLPRAEQALTTVLRNVDVSLILIDEAHNMDRPDSQGRYAGDHMRWLTSQLPAGTTLIYAGIGMQTHGPLADTRTTQSAGRYVFCDIPAFDAHETYEADDIEDGEDIEHDEADDTVWESVLREFEDHLRLYEHCENDLVGLSDYVLERTSGRMGSVAELFVKGAHRAIESGTERIDRDLLDQVELNWKSTKDAEQALEELSQPGTYESRAKQHLVNDTPAPAKKRPKKAGPAQRPYKAG